MRRLLAVGLVLGMGMCGIRAQTAKDAEQAFETSVIKQRMVLRDYSAEAKREYQWTAAGLESGVPTVRTLGIFQVSSVKWKNDQVEIQGQRMTVVRGDGKLEAEGSSSMELVIDMKGADPLVVAPKLKAQLFEATMADAIATMPKAYRTSLPYEMKRQRESPGNLVPKRYGLQVAACAVETPPKLLKQVDPKFSYEAMTKGYSGRVSMELTVDASGHVVDPWVAVSAGMGLDEEASKAVSQYVFQPAMCDGTPMAVTLVIDVNFQRR